MDTLDVAAESSAQLNDINRIARLKKLYELSMALYGDPVDVFKDVARMIGELFNVRVVCLSEIRGDELFFISVYVDGSVYQDAGRCPLEITPCATVETSKDIKIYDRVMERFPQASFLRDHQAFSYCGFPALDSERKVVAVTCLLDDKPHVFNDEDQELLRIFGQRIAAEIERARHINEHKKTEESLRHVQTMLLRSERLASIGSWEWDLNTNQFALSPEMYRQYQIDPAQMPSPDLSILTRKVDVNDIARVKAHIDDAVATGVFKPVEYQLCLANGSKRYVRTEGVATEFKNDAPGKIVGFVQDITEIKQAYAKLQTTLNDLRKSESDQRELRQIAQREQRRMSALLSAMSIGILFEDRKGHVEYFNPAFRKMWAIEEGIELTGQQTLQVLQNSTHRFARPDHASKHVLQVLDTNEISERFEIDLYDGRVLTQLSYPVTGEDGAILGRLWIYEDITHERQTAQQLLYLAERDALTGLYNRHRFQEQLEKQIRIARRSNGRFALLYFDLDEFKSINDTFGHRAGDTALVRVSGEISSLVRNNEVFARLGGDEFAILATDQNETDAGSLAARVLRAVSSIPFRFRGTNIRLTGSVGVAIYPFHGLTVEDLVAHADSAMYQAKAQGKNTWCVYDGDRTMSEAMIERMTWNRRISQALETNAFELHFQGIYDTKTWKLNHVEALIRLNDHHTSSRTIMPSQFIPIAEKNNQIKEIDKWVIVHSVAALAEHSEIPAIAVNVSGRSIDDPTLPEFIRAQIKKYAVAPERLIIELTETSAVSDIQDAQRFIEALQRMGCRVCLDDFGTGFSTFAYLKYLRVDVLKIDGMFIRDLANNHDNQAFVKAMVDVARGLHKKTIAECVEDEQTLDMISALGVDYAQGYHLHRPSATQPALN